MTVGRRAHLAGAGRAHDEYAEFAHDDIRDRELSGTSGKLDKSCDAQLSTYGIRSHERFH